MAVPYTFGSATTSIPLSQLDSNFATTITLGNTAIQLGNTVTTLNNMTFANVTISSVSTAVTPAQGGTGLTTLTANNVLLGNGTSSVVFVAPGTSGNALVSNGTTWTSTTFPAFSAYTNSTIQSISVATFTKITFAVEEFDTNNNFASSRFTPTVAGYYQVSGQSCFGGYTSTGLSFPAIYKNGSRFKDGNACPFDTSDGNFASVNCLVYLNGTTDYIELYVWQRSATTRDLNVGDAARNYFTAAMVRSA